jgi:hypothetical protein
VVRFGANGVQINVGVRRASSHAGTASGITATM